MDATFRLVVRLIYVMAGLTWLGALAFAGYRIFQMRTLPSVEAQILHAETESYRSKSYRRNAAGWNQEIYTRMYVPVALVRYEYGGKTITAEAKHDVGFSWKWVQDRLTREWKPGARMLVRIDPAKPEEPLAGLGMNFNTFLPVPFIAGFGFLLMGIAYGVGRLGLLVARFIPGEMR